MMLNAVAYYICTLFIPRRQDRHRAHQQWSRQLGADTWRTTVELLAQKEPQFTNKPAIEEMLPAEFAKQSFGPLSGCATLTWWV